MLSNAGFPCKLVLQLLNHSDLICDLFTKTKNNEKFVMSIIFALVTVIIENYYIKH